VETLPDDSLSLRDGKIPAERSTLSTLHAVVGPEHLLPVGQLDHVEGLSAEVLRRERHMVRGVPVLGQNDVVEARRESIDERNDLVAAGNGQAAAGKKAVLDVDYKEYIGVHNGNLLGGMG
jgi:hypothetical protein